MDLSTGREKYEKTGYVLQQFVVAETQFPHNYLYHLYHLNLPVQDILVSRQFITGPRSVSFGLA